MGNVSRMCLQNGSIRSIFFQFFTTVGRIAPHIEIGEISCDTQRQVLVSFP